MPEVWKWTISYEVQHTIEYDEVVIPMRAGHERIIQKGIPHSRADGTGSVSSQYGRFVFRFPVNRANFEGDQKFKEMLSFIHARKAGDPFFYFYNPTEKHPPDLTGADTTGRYLVRFGSSISYTLRTLKVYGFGTIELFEVFE